MEPKMNLTKRQRAAYQALFLAGLFSSVQYVRTVCAEALHALGEETLQALETLAQEADDPSMQARAEQLISLIVGGEPSFRAGLVIIALLECVRHGDALYQSELDAALVVSGSGFGAFVADAIEARNDSDLCLRFLRAARLSLRDRDPRAIDGIPRSKRRLLREMVGYLAVFARQKRRKSDSKPQRSTDARQPRTGGIDVPR